MDNQVWITYAALPKIAAWVEKKCGRDDNAGKVVISHSGESRVWVYEPKYYVNVVIAEDGVEISATFDKDGNLLNEVVDKL